MKKIKNDFANSTNNLLYIENDPELISVYQQIHDAEISAGGLALHDFKHVLNVANICKLLLQKLKTDDNVLIEEVQIAAILHDTGVWKEGKKNHAYRSYLFAKEYFDKNKIKLQYKDLVLDAIKDHSDVSANPNLISLTLLLSDKLDIKSDRITENGREIEGNRQFQYIKDIYIDVEDNQLIIDFICDKKMNQKELENYYFMKKVFKAISAFSHFVNLSPKILLNNKKWEAFYL